MKFSLKSIVAFLLMLTNSFLLVNCKKPTVVTEKEDQLTSMQAMIEKKLSTEGVKQQFQFSPTDGERKNSGRYFRNGVEQRGTGFCNAVPTLDVTNYNVTYTASGCGSGFSYSVQIDFSITFDQAVTCNSLAIDPTLALIKNDNSEVYISGGTTNFLSSSGNTYKFRTSVINVASNVYCDVKGFWFEAWPLFSCNGSSPGSTDAGFWATNLSILDRCKVLSPVFTNARTSTTVDYSGWVLACTPCNFLGSEQFEFEYRPVGSSTWTTLTSNYYTGPFQISGLSSGVTYEWRHRNKMVNAGGTNTPVPCYGPYSDIQTF